jgi:hypothetical protein
MVAMALMPFLIAYSKSLFLLVAEEGLEPRHADIIPLL